MWIQHLNPRRPAQHAIWMADQDDYWVFSKTRTDSHLDVEHFIVWWTCTALEKIRIGDHEIYAVPRDWDTYVKNWGEFSGTAKEIETVWEQIWSNPISFMMRRALE